MYNIPHPTYYHTVSSHPAVQMTNLVSEREAGLRTALCNMGMLDSSYWASWMAFDILMALLGALLIVIFGEEGLRGDSAAPGGGHGGWGGGRVEGARVRTETWGNAASGEFGGLITCDGATG